MPILGTIASSIVSGPPTPITAYYQIGVSTGATSSVTFSSIPQTYDHLEIWYYSKDNRGATYSGIAMRFNGVATAGAYTFSNVQCDIRTSGPFGGYDFNATSIPLGGIPGSSSSDYYGAGITRIMNYSDTTRSKSVVAFGGYVGIGDGSTEQGLVYPIQGVWLNNNGITSINIYGDGNTLQANTQIMLFGVKG